MYPISPLQHRALVRLAISLLLLLAAATVPAQSDNAPRPAFHAPLADKSLLLDVIRFNGQFVAVGERGHVLLSEDGQDWRQAENVPVQSTLTRVTSHGRRMWAVGHQAVILSSMDGGETWFIQHYDAEADGPLLDVHFINPNRGFAVGAYGRFMTTGDGGINWEVQQIADRVTSEAIDWAALAEEQGGYETLPDDFEFDDDDGFSMLDRGCFEYQECHLNEIIELGDGRMMIAAERGYGYRSTDSGETWESFRFPYSGSMFGMVEQGGCIVAFGLRGHVQRSCDFGDSWDVTATEGEQTLMGGVAREDGRLVFVGAGATRLTLHPDGRMERDYDRLGNDYAAVVFDNGGMVLVGEDGVRYE